MAKTALTRRLDRLRGKAAELVAQGVRPPHGRDEWLVIAAEAQACREVFPLARSGERGALAALSDDDLGVLAVDILARHRGAP